ncbi:hypothetical protein RvY_02298 [Ramazzottius varieornatus]|uniref:DDE Tnp4 domain-containing protein n=1 Tax=Ramazzottius varieornatus TaxID=947166 RepID=A0A1D1URB1_RAMVA|nr:hypothetical protein RvY_02298 [Ramazzottius varieornatus]
MELRNFYALPFDKHVSYKQFIVPRRRIRKSKALEEDAWKEEAFDLDRHSEKECRFYFRFKREHLDQLLNLRKMFGRSQGCLNRLFYTTLRIIDKSSSVLRTWDHEWLKEDNFEQFASSIAKKGLITNFYGGQRGSMHDSRPLNESRILHDLREKQNGFLQRYVLYGDSGYSKKNEVLHKPFSESKLGTHAPRKNRAR